MSSEAESRLLAELAPIRARRKSLGDYPASGCHASFFLEVEALLPAVSLLFERGYFLEDIAGVDVAEGILIVYHFDRYDAAGKKPLRSRRSSAGPTGTSASASTSSGWSSKTIPT